MSELHDRNYFLVGCTDRQQFQPIRAGFHSHFSWSDDGMGEEEGKQISEGVWRQVQEEEVHHVARYLLARGEGVEIRGVVLQ